MKLLYFGDVVGKSGRLAVFKHLKFLTDKYKPDLLILNGENAAHGFGITIRLAEEFFNNGIDVITLGNHTWDQREILDYIKTESRIIRPLNYPENTPGRGAGVFLTKNNKKVLVLQVMGRLFMDPLDDPFTSVSKILSKYILGKNIDCIVVDVHAEATSEKMAMGHFLDGQVSMVVGSHSHIPTADAQILPHGTAYQTDAGMCGDYDSVIGMKKVPAINRFLKKLPIERLEPSEGEATVAAVFLTTDEETGFATQIVPILLGGKLSPMEYQK